jgi:hypothetical protein
MGLGLSKTEAIASFQAIVETFQGEPVDWEEFQSSYLSGPDEIPEITAIRERFASGAGTGLPDRVQTCSFPDCQEASVRNRGCGFCKKYLCAINTQARYHDCPSMRRVSK